MKSFFHGFWIKWKEIGRVIGNFIARIILVSLYFSLVIPFSLIVILVKNPFKRLEESNTFWQDLESTPTNIDDARLQF